MSIFNYISQYQLSTHGFDAHSSQLIRCYRLFLPRRRLFEWQFWIQEFSYCLELTPQAFFPASTVWVNKDSLKRSRGDSNLLKLKNTPPWTEDALCWKTSLISPAEHQPQKQYQSFISAVFHSVYLTTVILTTIFSSNYFD